MGRRQGGRGERAPHRAARREVLQQPVDQSAGECTIEALLESSSPLRKTWQNINMSLENNGQIVGLRKLTEL